MFSAEPESPSFVEKAITSGRPFRRCAFAAIVTAVSVTPFASFARVFPVHGAMTIASIGSRGPSGSASAMVVTTCRPVICISRLMFSEAAPKRLSVSAAFSLIIGISSYFSVSLSASSNTRLYVQYEPHIAKPILFLFSMLIHPPR